MTKVCKSEETRPMANGVEQRHKTTSKCCNQDNRDHRDTMVVKIALDAVEVVLDRKGVELDYQDIADIEARIAAQLVQMK